MSELPDYQPPDDMTKAEYADICHKQYYRPYTGKCHPRLPETHSWVVDAKVDFDVSFGQHYDGPRRGTPDGSIEIIADLYCRDCAARIQTAVQHESFQYDPGCENCGEPNSECKGTCMEEEA